MKIPPKTTMTLTADNGTVTRFFFQDVKSNLPECVTSDGKFYIMIPSENANPYGYREIRPVHMSEFDR